jgi:20S proteasome alpha/beta subunit
MAGIAGDAKQIVNRARTEARSYREFYGSQIPGKVLNERLALVFSPSPLPFPLPFPPSLT